MCRSTFLVYVLASLMDQVLSEQKYVGMTLFSSVADPGFDLGVDLCQRRGWG